MQILKEYSEQFKTIHPESLKALISLASEKSYKKNEIITKIGDIPEHFYIIKQGVVRSFYVDEKGKEYIRTIFTPNKTTGSLGSLLSGKASNLTYQCLTDCIVYQFSFKELKELTRKDIAITNLYGNILENIFLRLESRIYDLSVLNATERYLKLKEEIPKLENLIPQYHIASYLNVSAVQLSRIRKEIYSK